MAEVSAKDMRLDDALASGDPAVIRAKLAALLHNVDQGDGYITIYSAQVCMAELLRLNVVQLEHSSNRLERLTKWLIGLTVALVILTIALFVVAIPPLLK